MRIGINVPDDLLKQVKEIRPEVNVSQVCREALEHRVTVAKITAARAHEYGAEGQIERLAALLPKGPEEPDWVAYAIEDAAQWVKSISPAGWEQFIYQADFLRRQGRNEAEMVDLWSNREGSEGMNPRLNTHRDWFEYQYDLDFRYGVDSHAYGNARDEYARAWLGYVNEARRLLEKRRAKEIEELFAEREEYRRSLPNPQAPSHLTP